MTKLLSAYETLDVSKRQRLHARARLVAVRFRSPVYLVGSALTSPDPRDWDVRVVMTHSTFYDVFAADLDLPQWDKLQVDDSAAYTWKLEGQTGDWTALRRRWGRECVKLTENLAKHTKLNIDAQIQPVLEANFYKDEPAVMLSKPMPNEYRNIPLERAL